MNDEPKRCEDCGALSDDSEMESCDFCYCALCEDCAIEWEDDDIGDAGVTCESCVGDAR